MVLWKCATIINKKNFCIIKLNIVKGEMGGMIEYIKLCMLPFLVSLALTWIIVLNVCIAEKYDSKTKRTVKNKKILLICPYFVKYIRLRTEILCYFLEILLLCQLIFGILFSKQYLLAIRPILINLLILFNGILFFASGIPSYTYIFLNFIKREKELKKEYIWKNQADIQKYKIRYPENKIIEEVELSYKNHISEVAFLLLPHNHKLNYGGFLRNSNEYFSILQTKYSFMKNEDLIIGNDKIYKEKVSQEDFLVESKNSGFYLHNYGNYQKIMSLVNQKGITGIQILFSHMSEDGTHFEFEKEIQEILQELKDNYGIKKIILCGHGLYGTLETILLSRNIHNIGMCLLGVTNDNLFGAAKNYVDNIENSYFIQKKTANMMRDTLFRCQSDMEQKCKCNCEKERFCDGFCEKHCSKYFQSLAAIDFSEIQKCIANYSSPMLYIELEKNMYSTPKNKNEIIWGNRCKNFYLKNIHFNMREKQEPDFPTVKDITRYELVQKCKPKAYLLLKQEPEIDDKVLNILNEFLEKLDIFNGK